jgi:hypothetical protein
MNITIDTINKTIIINELVNVEILYKNLKDILGEKYKSYSIASIISSYCTPIPCKGNYEINSSGHNLINTTG